jgi:two-component system C4-dicarboxylate transport response regulator DctD
MKILIVEDDLLIRNSQKELCEMNNWEVQDVASGQEAIDILSKTSDFDLVILDWHIPVVSGEEVYKWINKTFPDLPVLVITGDYSTKAELILYKPFTINSLLEKISSLTDI